MTHQKIFSFVTFFDVKEIVQLCGCKWSLNFASRFVLFPQNPKNQCESVLFDENLFRDATVVAEFYLALKTFRRIETIFDFH